MTGIQFSAYHRNVARVSFVSMLDDHRQQSIPRRLSIVGPCLTHEQWAAAHAERRRLGRCTLDLAPSP